MKHLVIALALAGLSFACQSEKKASMADASGTNAPACATKCASESDCTPEMKAACEAEAKAGCPSEAKMKASCGEAAKAECGAKPTN